MSDERKGVSYAKLLAEKGFGNIYLLSGGFEEFEKQFPKLIEGKKICKEEIKRSTTKSTQKTEMKSMEVTGKITELKIGEHKGTSIKKEVTGKVTDPNIGQKNSINI